MRCAPIVEMTGQMTLVPDGSAGTFAAVRQLRRLIDMGKTDLEVIQAATSIVYLTPQKDDCAEASAIYQWVRDHVRYQRDPVGVETIAAPRTTLRRMVGDCDDQVAVLGALLESAGYPVRLVIGAFREAGLWEHVWLQVWCDGQWLDADPTEPHELGWAPPHALTVWTERR
jgi:hypothetical protein